MPKNECKFNGENEFLISFVLLLFSLYFILFYSILLYILYTLDMAIYVCMCLVCVHLCVCLCRHMRKLMPALAACSARKVQRE